MRLLRTCIGCLCLSLLPLSASAQSFYEWVQQVGEYDVMSSGVELDIQRYLPLALKGKFQFDLEEEDIDLGVSSGRQMLCGLRGESQTNCISVGEIRDQAMKVGWHRTLARDLNLIVSGYELDAAGYTGQGGELNMGLPGILNIWQSGVDEMTNPVVGSNIASGKLTDESAADQKAEAVRSMLSTTPFIDREDGKESLQGLASALYRYRHGVQRVIDAEGSCNGNSDGIDLGTSGGALELLEIRWCKLEEALLDVFAYVDQSQSVAAGALVIFEPFIFDDINVILWLRRDDVGLAWKFPIEPVLPALVSKRDDTVPLLGGEYPDELEAPGPTEGICSHPIGKRGYLCRPMEAGNCPVTGTGSSSSSSSSSSSRSRTATGFTITLTDCHPYNMKVDQPIHRSESGPDICSTGGWREPLDPALFDDGATQTKECLTCMPDIDYSGGTSSAPCITGLYSQTGGTIRTCIDQTTDIPETYMVMKELVVAQQLCARTEESREILLDPPDYPSCCELQWYPALVACKAMAQDGKFDAVDIDITECAAALTEKACQNLGKQLAAASSSSSSAPAAFSGTCLKASQDPKLFERIEAAAREPGPNNLPPDVSYDTRVKSIEASFARSCSPNCKAQYENTIGNNLCYIGQCIEQAIEENRLIPGRMPLTANDEAFPWDGCALPDPQYGAYIELPPQNIPYLPFYRGLELVQSVDIAICQANGYPALTPPVLCAFSPNEQLSFPSANPVLFAGGFDQESGDQARNIDLVEQNAAGLGSRAATEMYGEYLDRTVRSFGELLQIAALLVEQIGETSFPSVMCPRYLEAGGCSIFTRGR